METPVTVTVEPVVEKKRALRRLLARFPRVLMFARLVAEAHTPDFKRYRNTESGVSPMAIPGTPGIVYTADGLEKKEGGIPISQARDHYTQLD